MSRSHPAPFRLAYGALTCALLCLALALAPATSAQARGKGPLVLAAASMQESLSAAAKAWAAKGHPAPLLSFAASSALARQVASGAPADLYISADEAWMDYVAKKGRIAPGTRTDFLANQLVLIAPKASRIALAIKPGFPLARALGKRRLAMADPDAVPAGLYGKASLKSLHVWTAVAAKIARGENVRAALALVERGEVPLGIVYKTDALASAKVRVVGTFPASSHPPITYPIARLKTSTNPQAEAFRRFLISPAGEAIFARFGFTSQ